MTDRPPAPNLPAAPEPAQVPATSGAAAMSSDDIQNAMIAAGLVKPPTGTSQDFSRVRIDGQTFVFGDPKNPDFRYDSPSDGRPAFRAQIARDTIEYNARYFDEVLAQAVQRPSIANKMCKTHLAIPTQKGERAEDGTPCRSCPVFYALPKDTPVPTDGNGIAKRCAGMLDLEFRLLNDEGTDYVDERVWTLSMSITGMIEWQGTFTDKVTGYVSDANFKRKLAILAAQREPQDIPGAILRASQSLANGGVFAEARIARAERNGNRFSVPSFNPYDIVAVEVAPALDTTEAVAADTGSGDSDDIPF